MEIKSMITIKSAHSVSTTADRLEAVLKAKEMTVFGRINHAEGAKKVGKDLRPTELLIFGNPNVGTLLIQSSQTAAIDLPLKTLIWEDESGEVWLGYDDPVRLAERHSIEDCEPVIEKITGALANFSAKAASAE